MSAIATCGSSETTASCAHADPSLDAHSTPPVAMTNREPSQTTRS